MDPAKIWNSLSEHAREWLLGGAEWRLTGVEWTKVGVFGFNECRHNHLAWATGEVTKLGQIVREYGKRAQAKAG